MECKKTKHEIHLKIIIKNFRIRRHDDDGGCESHLF